MKKIWVNKTSSFIDAKRFDDHYYLAMSSTERLDTVQFLREMHFKMKRGSKNESRKGLRRVIEVIQ